MRLPLLIHGKPTILKDGECATVFLPSGDWTIEHDLLDSEAFIHVRRPVALGIIEDGIAQKLEEYYLNDRRHKVSGNCSVRVYVKKPGSERHISVYAESAA